MAAAPLAQSLTIDMLVEERRRRREAEARERKIFYERIHLQRRQALIDRPPATVAVQDQAEGPERRRALSRHSTASTSGRSAPSSSTP